MFQGERDNKYVMYIAFHVAVSLCGNEEGEGSWTGLGEGYFKQLWETSLRSVQVFTLTH